LRSTRPCACRMIACSAGVGAADVRARIRAAIAPTSTWEAGVHAAAGGTDGCDCCGALTAVAAGGAGGGTGVAVTTTTTGVCVGAAVAVAGTEVGVAVGFASELEHASRKTQRTVVSNMRI
jgi:hypothetical protein